jgi:polysaccharide biosynthesis protein PslH
MASDRRRLRLLFVSQFPPSPPSFGAQRRIHGVMNAVSKHHDVFGVSLITRDLDAAQVERAMREYCEEVLLVPASPWSGPLKRTMQVCSLASRRSFEARAFDRPGLRRGLARLLSSRAIDVVCVELPFLVGQRLSFAPSGARPPLRVLDEHNIEFDLARQQASLAQGVMRRVHNSINWPKIRREEVGAFRRFDGVTFCSEIDEARARALVPGMRSAVVPNAVDLDHFRSDPALPPPDGRTVMFFGAINYFPNVDGLRFLFDEVWPIVARTHPEARLKIVGQHPTPEVLAFRGPRVEVTGRVDDLRPHLARAAVTVVPLRIGGGTRFKILEAMAMARPVVSTTLGAEGIDAVAGRDILLADDAVGLAAAIGRVLDDARLGEELGARGRALVEEHYSWSAASRKLEGFLRMLLLSRARAETS